MTGPKETPLHAGDEVRLELVEHPGVVTTGPIVADELGCCLRLGPFIVIQEGHRTLPEGATLTVTKLAPRPLYANHKREEPVEGDVCRDADVSTRTIYVRGGFQWFIVKDNKILTVLREDMPDSLILLVDGDTGLTVAPPS